MSPCCSAALSFRRRREDRGGRRHGLGLARRHPHNARNVGRVVDLARERRDAEPGELLGAGIGRKQSARNRSRQQLGLKIGVGLVQQPDCLMNERTVHGSGCDDGVRQEIVVNALVAEVFS